MNATVYFQTKYLMILQQFLENEVANNQEKEKKISIAERQAAKFRLDYQNSENARILFQDEVRNFFESFSFHC